MLSCDALVCCVPKFDSFYNINNRLNKHNTNKGAKSTKGYKWLLIYSKKFKSKSEAMSFEYKLKKDKTLRNEILNKSK